MATFLASILSRGKNSTNIFSQGIVSYLFGLMLTRGRKNYRSIARKHDITYDLVYATSKEHDQIPFLQRFLIQTIHNQISKSCNQSKIIVDFTLVQKPFASHMSDVTYDRDGVGKRVNKGFSLGFVVWTNGLITIPLDFSYWHRKKDSGDSYKKKSEIVIDLIEKVKNVIPVNDVLLDGAFATKGIINYLTTSNINYSIRCPRNRVIEKSDGTREQIQQCKELAMKRNQKYKTIKALCLGIPCFITAHKRKGKDNTYEVVYIMSNKCISPKKQVKCYDQRWVAEKFFRTAKQSLGLRDCQSINHNKQALHFYCIMVGYTLLHYQKNYSQKKSIEEVLTVLRYQTTTPKFYRYIDSMLTFM